MYHLPAQGPNRSSRRSSFIRLSCLWTLLLMLGLAAPTATANPLSVPNADDGGNGGGSDANLAVTRLFSEVFTQQKGEVCTELMTAGAVTQTPVGQFNGPDGFNTYAATIWAAFPDAAFSMDEVSDNGSTISVRWSMTGTHLGPLDDLAATNRPVHLEGLAMFELDGDRIASAWIQYDRLGLITQVTSPAPGACPRCHELP